MALNDEIKEQHKKLKDATLKEKWEYFLEYYKFHALAVIAAILFVVFLTKDILVASKPSYLYTAMVNYESITTSDTLEQEYIDYAGIDTDEYKFSIDTSLYISQKTDRQQSYMDEQRIFAMLAAQDIDLLIINEEIFKLYAGNETFYDLSVWLTNKQLEELGDSIYSITYEDGTTHQVGIDITNSPYMKHCLGYDYLSYQDEDNRVLLGFVGNSENKEHSLAFLDYILNKTYE